MIAGFMIAFALIFELTAHASEDDQLTKISFSAPVQVPGRILPAGTYKFVLASGSQDIVRIFNAEGTELFATIQTIPTERTRETDGTLVTLAERPDGQPAALVSWFYPGTDSGHEFIYSKQMETELAQDAKQTFVGDHGTMVSSGANGAGN